MAIPVPSDMPSAMADTETSRSHRILLFYGWNEGSLHDDVTLTRTDMQARCFRRYKNAPTFGRCFGAIKNRGYIWNDNGRPSPWSERPRLAISARIP